MYLDSKDSLRLSLNGIYEPLETELVQKEVVEGNVVLDLGAHIGYYTLIFARLVGSQGKVFAFEPGPDNFALLEKNVQVNRYRNVTLVQRAVSEAAGRVRLYLNEGNTADHRMYDSRDGRKHIEVETVRVDDYFAEYEGKIDFIKMDIQGAEGAALSGMVRLIEGVGRTKAL
ncbi:MAG: FkbM family methyltransferase [Terriglobia bacterium]